MTDESGPTPRLSLVMVVGGRARRASWAVAGLLDQDGLDATEVLLVVPGDTPVDLPGDCPAVRVVRVEPGTLSREARAHATQLARAPYVGFVEDHCRLRPGWVRAMIDRASEGWAGIGCEVHTANPGVGLSDVASLVANPDWLPPARAGEADLLSAAAVVYRRDLLLSYGSQLAALMSTDAALQMRLSRDGHRLYVEPAAQAEHVDLTSMPSLIESSFLFNRCLGWQRAEQAGWSPWRRVAFALGAAVLPLVRTLRQAGSLAPGRRRLFLTYLLPILATNYAAYAGLAAGSLLGEGDVQRRFSQFELNAYRHAPGIDLENLPAG